MSRSYQSWVKHPLSFAFACLTSTHLMANDLPFSAFGKVEKHNNISHVFASSESNDVQLVPELIELDLDGLGKVSLEIQVHDQQQGRSILKGLLMQSGVEVPFSEVILVEAKNETVMGSIETPQGKWLLMPDVKSQQHYLIKRHGDEINDDIIHAPGHTDLHDIGLTPEEFQTQPAPDKDSDGNFVIDIYMGFSEKALELVQDREAYAMMQLATVNNALKNSKIDNVRVRLVGTGVTSNHMGMSSSQLSLLKTWFAEDIAKYSPDVVAGFMLYENGFENQAGGWGYVNGYYNINSITSPNAFRHELGHNIGGVHCNDKAGYNFGFNNGMTKTHQCGNDINYYSNPNVTDMYGLAIGDPNTADMARIWRENAERHSGFRPAVVPFEDETQAIGFSKTIDQVSNGSWDYSSITVPEGTKRMVVTVNDGDQTDGGAVRLYVQKDQNPTTSRYHAASMTSNQSYSNNHGLAVNNIEEGQWIIGVNGIRNTSKDLNLVVYFYNDNGDAVDNGSTDSGNSNSNNQDTTNQDANNQNTNSPAELMSPMQGALISGGSAVFEYNGDMTRWLYVGTSQGGRDLYNQEVSGNRVSVSGLPQDGSKVYVTLWSYIDQEWVSNAYEFETKKSQDQTSDDDKDDQTTDQGNDTDQGSNNNTNDDTDNTSNNGSNTNENQLPIVEITAPRVVASNTLVQLDGSASFDPNGDNLTYIWRQESGINIELDNADQPIATFMSPDVQEDQTVSVSLTVFDGASIEKQTVEILIAADENLEEDKELLAEVKVHGGAVSWLMLSMLGFLFRRRK